MTSWTFRELMDFGGQVLQSAQLVHIQWGLTQVVLQRAKMAKLPVFLSAPYLPVGIRFRMYSQATTTGVMVTWASRVPAGTGGLPRLTVVVARTTWPWLVALSAPRISIVKPTGLLSAASPSSPNTRRYPLSYVFSGGYGGSYGGLVYQSSEFDIWASTSYSSDRAYYLAAASGIINPQNDTTKLYSFALRQRRDQLRILSLKSEGFNKLVLFIARVVILSVLLPVEVCQLLCCL